MLPPTTLTIAGSDSGGGAGIQADLKALAAVGVHGASAITCVTSQNTTGLSRVDPLPVEAIVEQIDQVLSDLRVTAVKTGMLHTPEVVEAVADQLSETGLPLVVDPVMVATSGDALATGELPAALAKLARITTLVTPNIDEAEQLTGTSIRTLDDARRAGEQLRGEGWQAVLVKGGHLDASEAIDVLVTADGTTELAYPRVPGELHGAGCTYASLIAGLLARGHPLELAVHEARARMHRAIQRAYAPGQGPQVLDALEAHEPGPAQGARLSAAAWRIAAILPRRLVPEVGINMAHTPAPTNEPSEVLSLSRRITRSGHRASPPGPVVQGASSHVAKVLLAAAHHDPRVTAAMNLAWHPDHLDAAKRAGLAMASFSRDEQPPKADSTMEWGTTAALKQAEGPIDLVVDDGGMGKEAMIRVLATDPASLHAKVEQLAREL